METVPARNRGATLLGKRGGRKGSLGGARRDLGNHKDLEKVLSERFAGTIGSCLGTAEVYGKFWDSTH
ncbi:hypothetical protein NPIL_280121 [Nephila pilipes]|uniref:Uncharacterized protein n=1 Tax=Nephila pilipes TaxID=299642 RepID=A0A8X6QW31_NEPPI|nr:hypothetical protein NPIL_280121 [Nephila pilipes]